ncbi:hypothetical protein ANN_04342 [Periplaneta americana]|uniref:Uncharacterized protein n=1 Tax=Periplaneta americana TaxID=6978 RepID=A0ABQ8T8A5_PERAM|nr:hypothetical protein ANN_04342 [Periplaneta americana]
MRDRVRSTEKVFIRFSTPDVDCSRVRWRRTCTEHAHHSIPGSITGPSERPVCEDSDSPNPTPCPKNRSTLYKVQTVTGVAQSAKALPSDPELRSGSGSVPAWADYLVGFFQRFSPTIRQISGRRKGGRLRLCWMYRVEEDLKKDESWELVNGRQG